jgi:hypothetical protein
MTDLEIRTPVPLRTLHGIELAAVGTWKASTGETTFTNEDFAAAVAALECPGVRNPVIKLGHAEEDSDSGVRWDGEPAVGWVANMRVDGPKIVGDLTGMPAWLADADENGLSVLAAAYPDRSIEIWRPFVCQVGHTHSAVITALSLLGVYAPGVGVLKSMQDVYAAFTQSPETEAQRSAMSVNPPITVKVTLAADEPREMTPEEKRSGVDFTRLREQWDSALDSLVDDWTDVSEAQRSELAAQVADAVDSAPDTLGDIAVDSAAAALLLISSMRSVAVKAAKEQVAAAQLQGVTLTLPEITDDDVRETADAVAATMAASTASAASRTAAQSLGTGDGKHVAGIVDDYLSGLSDRFLRDQLGGALSSAQMTGWRRVLEGYEGDNVTYYASELNDTRACSPCKSIDGRRFDTLDEANAAYGAGKYIGCAGGARCRGQIIAVFGAARASATVRTTLGGHMAVVKASVSVEDISRRYYESAGYSMYITAMHVDPLELIAADDSTGKFFRIPVELSGEEFVFGEAQEVAVAYQDVKAAASAMPVRFSDRKAALAAAGKREDGSDLVAPDVSPAGAAIRKAAEKAAVSATVIETEVPAVEKIGQAVPQNDQTPDADPAAGPTTTPKEASVDEVKMREALGLGPDVSKDEVAKAFAAQFAPPQPEPSLDPVAALAAKLPAGERPILVDPENYKALLGMAVKGEQAYARVEATRRDQVLEQAAKDGRFPLARLATYKKMWDKNPAETEAYINLMPKNTVPTLASGVLGQEISQNESDMAYAAMYGTEG